MVIVSHSLPSDQSASRVRALFVAMRSVELDYGAALLPSEQPENALGVAHVPARIGVGMDVGVLVT